MPETPSPAAGSGLPENTPSRRSVLARIPGAALATAAMIPNAAEAMANPDAELLALGERLEIAHAEIFKFENDVPDDFRFVEDDVAKMMIGVPAKTMAGLKVKVRALFIERGIPDNQWSHPEAWQYREDDLEDGLILSLMHDILAMGGANV